VFLVGISASFVPAWQASRIEFLAALKED